MKIIKTLAVSILGASSFMAMMAVTATPASAQATRTWVSGVGDDANPCSRTAPCKTFAGAISKTATNGEINCLDPGGFGGVTITKGMTIVCQYTEGGVLVAGAGVNGIVINAPAASHVYLRGLDIFGAGSATNGVRFIAGASLTIEDSVIRSFNATNGTGISFQPSGSSILNVSNTTINNNGSASTGNGILIQPTGAGGTARVVLTGVRVQSNANTGLRVDSTGNTGAAGINVVIDGSTFSGNAQGISVVTPPATTTAQMLLSDSSVSNNSGTGIIANGTTATIRVADSVITGNATGVLAAGGSQILSAGNNQNAGNPTVGGANNGAFTGAAPPS